MTPSTITSKFDSSVSIIETDADGNQHRITVTFARYEDDDLDW